MKKIAMPNSIQKIAEGWCFTAPFFQTFLANFKYFEDENIDTIAVSMIRGRMMMITTPNNIWFDQFDSETQKGILVHEILHLISGHLQRGRNLINKIYNIAADVCINENILQTTINGKQMKLPEEGCFKHNIIPDWKDELISEPIYNYLIKEIQNQLQGEGGQDDQENQNDSEGDQNEGSSGSGNGEQTEGNSKGGSNGEQKDGKGNSREVKIGKKTVKTMDDHSKLEEASQDDLNQQAIDNIVQKARNSGYGTVSANMQTFIEELLKPMVDWKRLLRNFVTSLDKGMRKMDTWRRANRRELPLMGKQKVGSDVFVLVDTSGSVYCEEVFSQFFTEIEKIVSLGFKVKLFTCDTELDNLGEYKKGSYRNIKIKGGGGTAMDPMFEWMRQNKKEKSKLIILTDGFMSYENIRENFSNIDTLWTIIPGGDESQSDFGHHKFVKMNINM